MNLERYPLTTQNNAVTFQFDSIGPKGIIRKIVQFQATSEPELYNLAFGDVHPEFGELDDFAISNNGDSEKVLATVIGALYLFFDVHPDATVYAEGSTAARTRLYRIGISWFQEEAEQHFYVYGRLGEEFLPFELGLPYEWFLVQRRFHTLQP